MENEFIPYEQALILKELGFDKECFAYYTKNLFILGRSYALCGKTHNAILYQQAFKFFREKYGLFTQDFIDLDNKFTKNIVKVLKNGQDFFYLDYYKTYEDAEIECLKKLIEIVKPK